MSKQPPSPNVADLQAAMFAEALREVRDHEQKAAKFSTVGSASDGSGDLIVVGRTHLGLMHVAIRLTTIQGLALCASLCGGLSQAMQAAAAEQSKLAAHGKPKS